MAEEEESHKTKKLSEFKEPVTSIGNSWIICRSQSHGGRIYYFNTLTGKAVWNLSDPEIRKAQLHTLAIAGQPGTNIGDCPEPMEPPGDAPNCSVPHHDAQKVKGPRIYNKQIINNQFTKPYAMSPFINPPCHCASLTPMNDVNVVSAPIYNPNIWAVPPTHQVFLAPTVSPLTNPSQPIFEDIKMQVQNATVPLSSRFQIINQLVNNRVSHSQGIHNNRPRFQNFPVRRPPTFTKTYQKKMDNDLRDVLSSKRKDFIKDDNETELQEAHKNLGNNVDDNSELTEDDLYPSDIDDKWLQENSAGNDKNLSLDISSIWRSAGGGAKTNCWFIIANTGVLLNHMSFLSSLINSDKRVHLMTPVEVLKRLRTATGAGAARLAQRARRAIRFAALQLHKIPAALKNLQNNTITSCCLELNKQNYNVVLLMNDDDELQSHNMTDMTYIFTISGLKEHLTQNSYAPNTNARENITSTVLSINDVNNECLLKDTKKTENNKDEIEIQTDQITSSVKRTVNASVQTDFEIKLSKSPVSTSESLEIDGTPTVNTVIESSNDSKDLLKAGPKRIKLNRNKSTTITKPVEKYTIKWRKRRVNAALTNPVTPTVDTDPNVHTPQEHSAPTLSTESTDDLIHEQSDNGVDNEKNTEISNENVLSQVDEKVTNEETCELSVISNSVDSESTLNVNEKAIISESKDNEKGDIVMFEVAGDLMAKCLIMRRDEWVSRFVQIMEEALTQILQLEPYEMDLTIPPPWSIQEATECITRKFMNNKKVVFAADKLAAVLLQITDNGGKFHSQLNPSDFMELYSYGVYLINALEEVLMDSEDLHIARKSLSKLLEDIQDPNSHNVFIDDDKVEKPMDSTEEVTNIGDNIVPATKETSPIEDTPQDVPAPSNKSSPLKYNLRSNKEQKKDAEVRIIRTINDDDSFFTSLRLQKKNISQDGSLKSSFLQQKSKQDSNEDSNESNVKKIEPKIIRNFNICPKMEETLKSKENLSLNEEFDDDYFAEDNNCPGNEFYLDEKDYACDVIEESYSRSPISEDIDVHTVLKWFLERTTYPIHRILSQVHKFCNETYEDLNTQEKLEHSHITKLYEKTMRVNAHMGILCKYLNRILHRKNTESKFRCMVKELGFDDIAMSNSQVEEYVAVVEKYTDQANLLLDSVNLIAAAIKEKQIITMDG